MQVHFGGAISRYLLVSNRALKPTEMLAGFTAVEPR